MWFLRRHNALKYVFGQSFALDSTRQTSRFEGPTCKGRERRKKKGKGEKTKSGSVGGKEA